MMEYLFNKMMLPDLKSVYSFERCELRTLQNMCEGDNEKFLNYIADMVGKLSHERDELRDELRHTIRCLED